LIESLGGEKVRW